MSKVMQVGGNRGRVEVVGVDVGGLDLDGFLGHKTMGGGGSFLKNWRKEGRIVVALHRTAPIYALWAHGWHEVVEVEDGESDDEDDKVLKVYNRRFVCHEREVVLRKQRYRERDGSRELPPEVCPSCLLTEHVHQSILAGELSWTDPIFEFEGDDPEYNITVFAGGLCGMFQSKDLDKKQLSELRKAGIRRDEAFKQNMVCRCQYVLSVVDVEDPSAGVQTTIEATSLGDKLKGAIRKEQKRRKPAERGNPAKYPYPFEFTYDDSQSFDEKYDVCALDDELSDAVLRLIGTGDRSADLASGSIPDLSDIVTPSNCLTFRAQVEKHLMPGMAGAIPFDEIFGPAEEAGLMKAPTSAKKDSKTHDVRSRKDEEDEEDEEQEEAEPAKKASAKAEPAKKASAKAEPAADSGVDCDHCGKEMSTADLTCPSCGATYDEKTGVCDGRPCAASGCKSVVPVDVKEQRHICPKCATVHELFVPDGVDPAVEGYSWRVVEVQKAPDASAGRRRRSGGAAEARGGATSAPEPSPTPEPAPTAARGAKRARGASSPKA